MEFVDTKLHEAVRYGDTNLVESALKENLDPNAIGLYQWGPLHEAANSGDLDILLLLLQYKGDPNGKDDLHACTPVHYACKEGHVDCLEALLEMGGRYDITNGDGETGLDVAVGKCRELLDRQRAQELIQETLTEQLGREGNERKAQQDSQPEMVDKESRQEDNEASPSPSPSLKDNLPTAWDAIEVQETNADPLKDAGTGFLQLSFEYNSRTSIMKIRVWKLEDILLPPAEIASITRISIRSRLLPDKKGETKRKTEEAKLEDLEKMKTSIVTVKRKTSKESFKAIYLPCTFQFTRPLEYKNISKEMVSSKTLHIDVNVKQKYSSKHFTVANLQLPLKEAVRRLRKKRYRLHPCINYSMPDNIHSYDPRDLIIVSEGMYSNKTVSNPNLRTTSNQSLKVGSEQQRATSDINLQTVRCHSVDSIPSVSLSIPSDEQEDDALQAIAVMNDSPRSTSHLSRSNPEIHVVEIHEMDSFLPGAANTDLAEVKVEAPLRKISKSSPNIPILQIEDLETYTPPKKLNRPTSPPNRLAVPPVSYNRKHQQSSSKPKQELPDAENHTNLDHRPSKRAQEPPRPGRAVPASTVHTSGSLPNPEGTSFTNPSGDLHIQDHTLSGLVDRKRAVKANIREKKNKKTKEGRHALLRAFSEQEGIDSTVFEPDENSKRSPVEYREVSELPEGPVTLSAPTFNRALGQQTAAKGPKSSKIKSKSVLKESKIVLPMSELTLNSGHLPQVHTISETQFGKLSSANHSTPKKMSRAQGRSQISPRRPDGSNASPLERNFPQPITCGLSHTELKRPTSPKDRLSSPEDPHTMSLSQNPGSEGRVHFLSETEPVDPRYRQTSPARRIRPPIHQSELKTSKKRENIEIEMSSLQLDPEFQKQMSTPEFKLQMFQRTGRDPHPSEHFIKNKHGSKLLDARREEADPFFVPETPTGSPMAADATSASLRQGKAAKSGAHVHTDRRMHLKQGEMISVENLSVVRVKQSVL